MVERLFLAVPRGCLRFVIVVFPDHTHLLFFKSEPLHAPGGFIFYPSLGGLSCYPSKMVVMLLFIHSIMCTPYLVLWYIVSFQALKKQGWTQDFRKGSYV